MSHAAKRSITMAATFALAAACTDTPSGIATRPRPTTADLEVARVQRTFARYVAVGTSISMGWQSDGVLAPFQSTGWPAQLAAAAGVPFTLPLIATPGCRSPLVAPLAGGVRLSGEAAAAPSASLSCAPNAPGVTLPARNVAINAATTHDALFTTPQTVTDASNAGLYQRVLGPGQSQIRAMMAQQPTIVSVELGGNELLNARSGVALPGVTIVPYAAWAPEYLAVLDSVGKVAPVAVLMTLVEHTATLPAFRRGADLWDARARFASLNVAVSSDCEGSQNLLFLPVRVPTAVATGAARARAGQGPATLSCANAPSSSGVQDFVLDPGDVALLDGQLAQMNALIASEAARRGMAVFSLGAAYALTPRTSFDPVAFMTGNAPYGPFVSLDGIHPSTAGHTLLAAAAARALILRYGLRVVAPN
jgi:hypothetical protein